jgi:hypothetical protein
MRKNGVELKNVYELANLAEFPATGEQDTIYIAADSNITYRWTGAAYVEIGKSGGGGSGAAVGDFITTLQPTVTGALEMNGQAVSRTTYANLYGLVGDGFGAGDGSTTFNVPNSVNGDWSVLSTQLTTDIASNTRPAAFRLSSTRFILLNWATQAVTFVTVSGNTLSFVASPTSLPDVRVGTDVFPAAVLLQDGRIFVSGGQGGTTTYFLTITGDDISTVAGSTLPVNTYNHAAVQLQDGRVLLIAGLNSPSVMRFLTITGNTFTIASGTNYPISINKHAAIVLDDGRVLVIGGGNASARLLTISGNTILYSPASQMPASYTNFNLVHCGNNTFFSAIGTTTTTLLSFFKVSGDVVTAMPQVKTTRGTNRAISATVLIDNNRVLHLGGDTNSTMADIINLAPPIKQFVVY